jgi:hypothetical protein
MTEPNQVKDVVYSRAGGQCQDVCSSSAGGAGGRSPPAEREGGKFGELPGIATSLPFSRAAAGGARKESE